MRSYKDYINEARDVEFIGNPKGGFGGGDKRLVAYKIKGVTSEMREMECASMWRKIQNDKSWKKSYVDTKGKAYRSAIKRWVKDYKPSEYMLVTRDESSTWHSDGLEIYYKD